ncbi:MAG: EamA family transporter [Methanomicrobiales archaeon]|nr:EamA family transporter [Methanomicrobiales archaeon]
MGRDLGVHPALFALGAAILFGASTPFAKILLSNLAPLPLAASLYLGSGCGILPFLALRGRKGKEAAMRRGDLPWLFGGIFFGGILAPVILLYGLERTSASTGSLLLNVELVATALGAYALFHEEITRRVWGAIAVLVAGSILLSWNGMEALGFSSGALVIIAAAGLWGIDNNLTCVIAGKDPLVIAALKGFLAGGVLFAGSLIIPGSVPPPETLAPALLLGFFSYGLSTILFILSLRSLGSTRTSSYFSTAPFIGAILSLLIFRNTPGIFFFLALILMLAGLYLLTRETHNHLHRHYRIVHEHRHRHDLRHLHEGEGSGEHAHFHVHEEEMHAHPHTPDLHHKHEKE